ncbi:uncharacterized protein [Hetaerina americana]|uniref:uncharacterized protein n=1 Tax=Hetaerina americana TaxID=62018 RepID=UPI003A7F1EEE
MSGLSRTEVDCNADSSHVLSLSGFSSEECKVESSNSLNTMNYTDIKPNENVLLPLKCDTDSPKSILNEGGVIESFDNPDAIHTNDQSGVTEKKVESIESLSFHLMKMDTVFSEHDRDMANGAPGNSEGIQGSGDESAVTSVFRDPLQGEHEFIKPSQILTAQTEINTNIKDASCNGWKWHGTPRPTKPIRATCLSESSSREFARSYEVTPSKGEEEVFKRQSAYKRPKCSSASKIPISCSTATSKYGIRKTSPRTSKASKL